MNKGVCVNRLNALLTEYQLLRSRSKYRDLSDLPKSDRQSLVTKCVVAVQQISGSSSPYSDDIKRILGETPALHEHTSSVIGVVQALRDNIDAGYIQTITELIHGEVFADFLEMAQYLSDSKYKDAAAVIAGSTLENHIRKLCRKNSIPVEEHDPNGDERPKKIDSLNSELARRDIYSKLDQKNVTAWLGLRNNAAHGNYTEYTLEQVALLISGVRDFITRNPA